MVNTDTLTKKEGSIMLKKRNPTVNVLTAAAAVLLSALLVVCLSATSLYGAVVNSVSAKSISKMTRTTVVELVESVDFEEMILKNEVVKQHVDELNISTDAVGELMQSDAADEVIDLLSEDVANVLAGKGDESLLTAEALIGIVKEHADDLADIAVEMTDEPLKKGELKQQIIDTVERDAEELTEAMPNVQTIRKEIEREVPIRWISALLNPLLLWVTYGVCLLLAGLIYACRWYRFGGFLWLGIDSLLAGGLLGVAAFAIRLFGTGSAIALPDGVAGIVGGLIDTLRSAVQLQAFIWLGAAVVLIAGYILLQQLVVKKKIAAATAAPAAEAEPATIEE